jgi:uncharacterized 2Fe-2S/4Fe-4S cluster protein (DUF4445 family)
MVLAGNTTMLHLVLGVDPTSLGTAPFTPVFLEHRMETAADLSLRLQEPHLPESDAPSMPEKDLCQPASAGGGLSEAVSEKRTVPQMAVHVLPGAAAYVGADITAGVLASGMAYREDTCMLVDLGTNGEIVLRHQGQFLGCATAAGPAFEGAGLTCGMRAGKGAISHVWLDGAGEAPTVEVIGHGQPIGICGTAYIDFVSRAREVGLIGPTARFVAGDHPSLIRHEKHGRSLAVATLDHGDPLLITEGDMASLLQAKAAIAAGVICLLREADVQAAQVQRVYLAGGFGFHMHLESLLGCGMLPGFEQQQVEAVGNTALAGAYLTLLDSGALREIRNVSSQMRIIELNLAPRFESIYIDQLILP